MRKEGEPWDAWCSALAPSAELVASFYGKRGPIPDWETYRARYLAEIADRDFYLDGFAAQVARGETLTLLCSSACTDPARCHRTLLAEVLQRRIVESDAGAPESAPRVTRSRRATRTR